MHKLFWLLPDAFPMQSDRSVSVYALPLTSVHREFQGRIELFCSEFACVIMVIMDVMERFRQMLKGKTNDDMVIYDTRLNVMVIPMETTGKVTLRFSFSKVNGYWYMSSVKVTDTNTNKEYNLTTDEDIMAPEYFSYHCNGFSVFSDDLLGNVNLDIQKIKKVLNGSKSDNVLSAIITPTIRRPKREAEEPSAIQEKFDGSSKPIIYRAQNTNNKLYALLYSSKPLMFRRNDSDGFPELHLGKTNDDMVIYDTRLNVMVIPMETTGKVTLRFSFSKVNGYWYMSSVKVTDTNTNKEYNLTTDEDMMAPEYFSYHCNGFSVFSDGNGTELYIYDIQVQIDSRDGKFGDVNDCVTFTTAPIWSGLFVTTIMGIGLIIALTAILDIKTMDKFDNHKTKNLAITVIE